jgi:hypothetical protein
MPTRHSGTPACTRRSHISTIIKGGLAADLAPSMSQSLIFLKSLALIAPLLIDRGKLQL